MQNKHFVLTQEEAKKKMCPFITASNKDDKMIGNIHHTFGYVHTKCQANNCMAWIPVESPESNTAGYCSRC